MQKLDTREPQSGMLQAQDAILDTDVVRHFQSTNIMQTLHFTVLCYSLLTNLPDAYLGRWHMKDYNADRLQNILRAVRRSALPFYRRAARVLVLKATMSGAGIAPHSALEFYPLQPPNISGRGNMQKGHQQCNCLIAFLALTTANSICFESPESPMRMRREFLTRCFAYNSH